MGDNNYNNDVAGGMNAGKSFAAASIAAEFNRQARQREEQMRAAIAASNAYYNQQTTRRVGQVHTAVPRSASFGSTAPAFKLPSPLIAVATRRALLWGFVFGFAVAFGPHALLHPASYLTRGTPLLFWCLKIGLAVAFLVCAIFLAKRKRLGWAAVNIALCLGASARFNVPQLLQRTFGRY